MKKKMKRILAASSAACMLVSMLPPVSAEEELETYLPISLERPVYSDSAATAAAAVNSLYFDGWQATDGNYLAVDMSNASHLDKIELVWYSGAWGNYDYTVLPESAYASLAAYTIEVNTAPGGDYPDAGWKLAKAVTGCTTHSGEHVLDFKGYNWVRLTVDETQNGAAVTLNVDIHALQSGVVDSWMFYGDSITACGMTTFGTSGGNFADFLHELDESVYPAQQNGGIGGIRSTEGKANIDKWLAAFDGQYVSIAYGTNDCWGDQTGAQGYYENTVYMIEAAQAAGKTVVLPKIPFSLEPGVADNVEKYNAMIDKIYAENSAVIPGPDFYAFFKENPDLLSGDGVHPSDAGYTAMRKLWAETLYEKIYRMRGHAVSDVVYPGDVNHDYEITLADAVLLQRYLITDVTSLRFWEAADYNGDGRINAADLTLLKRYLLRTEDEIIDDWLEESNGNYTLLIDYGAWTDSMTSYSVSGMNCDMRDNREMHTLIIVIPKSDPRIAGKNVPVKLSFTMSTPDMRSLTAILTFYETVWNADGTLAALYNYTNYTVDAEGNVSTGESI